ncbi:MAG: class I SAM-dependent methyltransferase [Thermodesulfobacteriota bacterium]
MPESLQAEQEIAHGRMLAQGDTELTWGWGTPAGQIRARRRAALIAQYAGLGPGVRALEIGCGTGLFTEMFAQTGARLVALDISEDLLEKAFSRNLPPERVKFIAGRLEDYRGEALFDAVIGSSILHHLDLRLALPRIYALLKPGGRIGFAEPNLLNPQVFIERRFAWYRPWFWYVSPDETAFVRWRLAGRLQQAGFADLAITPFDWLHPAIPESLIAPAMSLGRLLEKLPLIKEFAGSLCISGRRPPGRGGK